MVVETWQASDRPIRQPKAGPRATRVPTEQQAADLAALRLNPRQLPRDCGSLSAAVNREWPGLGRGNPGLSGWGWGQTHAFQRLRLTLPR